MASQKGLATGKGKDEKLAYRISNGGAVVNLKTPLYRDDHPDQPCLASLTL